jgi:hypothetical protein
MLRTTLAHLRAQWAGFLALFLVIAGGTAYAANTIGSADIIDESIQSVDVKNGQVRSSDIGNNQVQSADVRDWTAGGGLGFQDLGADSVAGFQLVDGSVDRIELGHDVVTGAHVADGTLKDEDVGQGAFVDFAADVGTVAPHYCHYGAITGINDQNDHLLLTPSAADSERKMIYSVVYGPGGDAELRSCNMGDTTIGDGITHFNLLVIDAG